MEVSREKYDGVNYGLDFFVPEDEMSDKAKEAFISQSSETSSMSEGNPGCGGVHYMIPEAAFATYGLLLGTTSHEETAKFLMYIRDNGEPSPDPETGENAWTSAYNELEAQINGSQSEVGIYTTRIDDGPQKASRSLSGISKTRSMLGLPSLSNELTTFSAYAEKSAETSEVDDGFYKIPSSIYDMIDEDAVDRARDSFIMSLTTKADLLEGDEQ